MIKNISKYYEIVDIIIIYNIKATFSVASYFYFNSNLTVDLRETKGQNALLK